MLELFSVLLTAFVLVLEVNFADFLLYLFVSPQFLCCLLGFQNFLISSLSSLFSALEINSFLLLTCLRLVSSVDLSKTRPLLLSSVSSVNSSASCSLFSVSLLTSCRVSLLTSCRVSLLTSFRFDSSEYPSAT